jgi:hypothetical protein
VAHSCAPGRVLADRPRRPIRSLGHARVRLDSLARPDQLVRAVDTFSDGALHPPYIIII